MPSETTKQDINWELIQTLLPVLKNDAATCGLANWDNSTPHDVVMDTILTAIDAGAPSLMKALADGDGKTFRIGIEQKIRQKFTRLRLSEPAVSVGLVLDDDNLIDTVTPTVKSSSRRERIHGNLYEVVYYTQLSDMECPSELRQDVSAVRQEMMNMSPMIRERLIKESKAGYLSDDKQEVFRAHDGGGWTRLAWERVTFAVGNSRSLLRERNYVEGSLNSWQ